MSLNYYSHRSRPLSGLLVPIGRRAEVDLKSTVKKPFKMSRGLSASPYNIKNEKRSESCIKQIITVGPNEIAYSWSCKLLENKFRLIRPCIIIKPNLEKNLNLFGFCDAECKESASLISTLFTDIIEQQEKITATPKHSLKLAYQKTLSELGPSLLISHEFCAILLQRNFLNVFCTPTITILIGRKTLKNWEGSKISKKQTFQCRLEDSEKIIILGNSALFASTTTEKMLLIASKYFSVKNPNMASWEIIDQTQSAGCPICLVLFIGP